MTDHEKVLWKIDVFQQCEDTEDYLAAKLKDVEQQKKEMRDVITQSHQLLTNYSAAVEKIGQRADEKL